MLSIYNKQVWSTQAKCKYILSNKNPCKGLALKGSLFCKHHTENYTPKTTREEVRFPKRYNIDSSLEEAQYQHNLNADNIYSVKDEIAILQVHLQNLINNHTILSKLILKTQDPIEKTNYINKLNRCLTTQLQLIDRLDKLIKTTKDLEFREKGQQEVSKLLSIVLAKVVYIINANIQDISLKRLIAEELYRIGQDKPDVDNINSSKREKIEDADVVRVSLVKDTSLSNPCSTIEQQPTIQPLVYEQANTTTYGIVNECLPQDNLNDTTKVSLCIDSQGK